MTFKQPSMAVQRKRQLASEMFGYKPTSLAGDLDTEFVLKRILMDQNGTWKKVSIQDILDFKLKDIVSGLVRIVVEMEVSGVRTFVVTRIKDKESVSLKYPDAKCLFLEQVLGLFQMPEANENFASVLMTMHLFGDIKVNVMNVKELK